MRVCWRSRLLSEACARSVGTHPRPPARPRLRVLSGARDTLGEVRSRRGRVSPSEEKIPNGAKQAIKQTGIFIFKSNLLPWNCIFPSKHNPSAPRRVKTWKEWEKGGDWVASDFQPQRQWSSMNSSTQRNPQPVGKCEKLQKVIYTPMLFYPGTASGCNLRIPQAKFHSFFFF